MTDLRALNDAFEELERRADAATAARPFDLPHRNRAQASRLVPMALAAAAVAGLVTGAVLLVPNNDPGTQAAQPGGSTTTAPITTTTATPPPPAYDNPELLAERFRAVLGDLATFTVTETGPGASVMTLPDRPITTTAATATAPTTTAPSTTGPQQPKTIGSSIVGTLTSAGVTGGFDLLMYPGLGRDGAWCDAPDEPSCSVRELPDGSSLATSQVALESGGVTHQISLVRPDGLVFVMHVSNRQSPKGSGPVLGTHPPLTVEQLVRIATSDRW
ncbi:hypothetical protein B0I31_102765 [Saccharothrix carnea]|uniref:Uncharacterized protein n=1 Tax=Saccharothrix carnea TaxID=1280637 RepID=A0A2P8IH57_SACCR|nr:hypothetical protein [Saccharothrix carnea]PSL57786.1 hypothetical protein B0I31_102765 [Saccharothrix carnea]